MTEFLDIPTGRDLIKAPSPQKVDSKNDYDTDAWLQKLDSAEYNDILYGLAKNVIWNGKPKELKNLKDMIENHPETVEMLRKPKDSDGKDLFTNENVCRILVLCNDNLIKNPDKVQSILDNPAEIKSFELVLPKYRFLAFMTTLDDSLKS